MLFDDIITIFCELYALNIVKNKTENCVYTYVNTILSLLIYTGVAIYLKKIFFYTLIASEFSSIFQ